MHIKKYDLENNFLTNKNLYVKYDHIKAFDACF